MCIRDRPENTDGQTDADGAAGGTDEPIKDDVTIRIGGLKGPTSIGLVKLMEDNEAGTSKNDYDFTVAGAADELTPKPVSYTHLDVYKRQVPVRPEAPAPALPLPVFPALFSPGRLG